MHPVLTAFLFYEGTRLLSDHPRRFSAVSQLLQNQYFNVVVDLGCGEGKLGPVIRDQVGYLIGVDENEKTLQKAYRQGLYDELVVCDIRNYPIPGNADLVCLLEVIEHLPKEDGLVLLQRIRAPIILSTPSKYYAKPWNSPHLSLWTPEELQALGFTVYVYPRGLVLHSLFGLQTIAVRGALLPSHGLF